MSTAIQRHLKTLESLWRISDYISSTSSLMSVEEINRQKDIVLEARQNLLKYQNDSAHPINAVIIKEFIELFIFFWNEWLSFDSERFWAEVAKENVEVKRKKSLRNILARGRILNVHEAMSARSQWSELMASSFIADQFSEFEKHELEKIMLTDELKRVSLFRKCIRNQNLPNSSALMYWDSMAYFAEYNLFYKHFTLEEISQIIQIRKASDERMLQEISESKYPDGGRKHSIT